MVACDAFVVMVVRDESVSLLLIEIINKLVVNWREVFRKNDKPSPER